MTAAMAGDTESCYPGPYCRAINLCNGKVREIDTIKPLNGHLKNGVVFEVYSCLNNLTNVLPIVHRLCPDLKSVNQSTLKSKFNRLNTTKKKLVSRIKVKGVTSVKDLYEQTFDAPASKINVPKCSTSSVLTEVNENTPPTKKSTISPDMMTSANQVPTTSDAETQTFNSPQKTTVNANVNDCTPNKPLSRDEIKSLNFLEYELEKKQKRHNRINREIELSHERLKTLHTNVGHFSARNVNKRDAIARKNRTLLRETQTALAKQKKIGIHDAAKIVKLTEENENMKNKTTKLHSVELSCKVLGKKKTQAQKNASHYKTRLSKLKKEKYPDGELSLKLKRTITEKDAQIRELEIETDVLNEQIKQSKVKTRKTDGSFTDNMRICVMELSGLEVAVEKVSDVIRTVSKHLFAEDLCKPDLPTSTTVQKIVNEGHYLAKTYVSQRITETENWGLNRDGTTRKKKKILDTSVTLASGDIISLGFSRVAHETAVTINDITKHHLSELAELNNMIPTIKASDKNEPNTISSSPETPTANTFQPHEPQTQTKNAHEPQTSTINSHEPQTLSESLHEPKTPTTGAHGPEAPTTSSTSDFIVDTLAKLAFSMSDRASNEKLADKLLDQWRDEMLSNSRCSEDQKHSVHHFHCMAHVLLGFHKYACDNIKPLETTLAAENGPLGRDALSVFKFWRSKGSVTERVLRTTSDTFGPAGDHLGLRDKWDAHCAAKGIKSVLGNYCDNRFNAIFQTSAEVLLHVDDILQVISTVPTPNLKLKAVQADLRSDTIRLLLQCFGLVYVKVTGPYWNLVTSGGGHVPYLLLYTHVQSLRNFLEECSNEPALMINSPSKWISEDISEIIDIPNRQRFLDKLLVVNAESRDLLYKMIALVTAAMVKTVEKQRVDFLPGGKYSEKPTEDDLKRTSFAHTTNLGCEHHFGDLDSSQKRRPNASMHHHSSVQLLKRNRKSLMKWLSDMPSNSKETLLKNARKGGRVLREAHISMEKQVISTIHSEMVKEKNPKKRRKKNNTDHVVEEFASDETTDEYDISDKLPVIENFVDNEYVAVAYQDRWYPGCVKSSTGDEAIVNFLAPCRKPGCFTWPTREDTQKVDRQFILKRGFVPECMNSGRQWYFADHVTITALYDQYRSLFFR